MTSRSKNVNLNKEPFEGYVRHWKRQWVQYGDKAKEDKGAWTLRLVKWVQTGQTKGAKCWSMCTHTAACVVTVTPPVSAAACNLEQRLSLLSTQAVCA
jgi:hypothetical protein